MASVEWRGDLSGPIVVSSGSLTGIGSMESLNRILLIGGKESGSFVQKIKYHKKILVLTSSKILNPIMEVVAWAISP